ncbi:hypothetical protein DL763_003563 [Monosporascus cannonballus]|nr:hypothetical protein DL763_003563 [Monosporascus cannonballus]
MSLQLDRVPRKKVAIVGSGCAGIAALWALNRTHHDAYLFEAANRLGGHTNTVEWRQSKFKAMVDTGFAVFNTATYPNFVTFLERMNVPTLKVNEPTRPIEMILDTSPDNSIFQWAWASLRAMLGQGGNLFSLRAWRLIFDIVRFNQFSVDLLREDDVYGSSAMSEKTIGDYLYREGYSDAFRDDYLIPLMASVWCTSPDEGVLDLPALAFVRFMRNHHLLSTMAEPGWRTLEGGAKSYIDAVMRGFPPNHLFLKTPVKHLTNDETGRVRLYLENGKTEVFDHVILATHGDQAYQIIEPSATEEEKAIMSAFKSVERTCVLHSDISYMPKRRDAWSSMNSISLSSPWVHRDIAGKSLTYNMNILQHIPRRAFGDVLVTMNPIRPPRPETVQGRYSYAHPVYDSATVRAQKVLPRIQNTRGISYAGAWTSYGSHEDGFTSGLYVAKAHLGARLPFELVDSASRQGEHKLGLVDLFLRAIILLIQVFVIDFFGRVLKGSRVKSLVHANGNANGKKSSWR